MVILLLASLALAACGDTDTNSTRVSGDVRPATAIQGAQQNNNSSTGIPVDPTKNLTIAAGATSTAGPATPAGQPASGGNSGGAASTPPATAAAGGNGAAAPAGDGAAGLKVFQANGCGGCHLNNGKVKGTGPVLANTKRDDAYIRNNLKNGKGVMPPYPQIQGADLDNLVTYILTLK